MADRLYWYAITGLMAGAVLCELWAWAIILGAV